MIQIQKTQMLKNSSQTGFAHVVIVIALAVLLLTGTLFALYVKNINNVRPRAQQSVEKNQPDTRVTTDIQELPESLRATAELAETMIVEQVGIEVYEQYYRIAPESSVVCSQRPQSNGRCVAFIYLPPSENGLEDTFLYATYRGEQIYIYGATNCLDDPESCMFNISKEEAITILDANGHKVKTDEVRLSKVMAKDEWHWSAEMLADKGRCTSGLSARVDVARGAYSEEAFKYCE